MKFLDATMKAISMTGTPRVANRAESLLTRLCVMATPGRQHGARIVAAAAMALLLAGMHGQAAFAEVGLQEWGGKPYEYHIVEQDLRTVLEEYGKNLGVRVTLSAGVQGRVKGNMPRGSARMFLDALSRAYGLDWYHDGFALHVSASGESRSRSLDLQDVPFEAALSGLKVAGLHDPRFQFRPGVSPSLALVSGPPRFVELVSEAVASMTKKRVAAALPAGSVMHVYRGAGAVEKVTFP